MSDVRLGELAPVTADRDATHVAVVPMIAGHELKPGEHVGILSNGSASVTMPKIGIVDPYLTKPVAQGERFYLCLYPSTITGLRHVYDHPALPPVQTPDLLTRKAASEQWLRDFCARVDCPGYELVIAKAITHEAEYDIYEGGGGRLHFNGEDAHGEIPPEFWEHAEVVTGRKFTKRPDRFSCTC